MAAAHELRRVLTVELEAAWARSDEVLALFPRDSYHTRPIPLRNPLFFYHGHLPAFAWNTIFRGALGEGALDVRFDELFARGIDPDPDGTVPELASSHAWPDPDEVDRYRDRVRDRVRELLVGADLSPLAPRLLAGGRVLWLVLEHELMHHETLMYMAAELPALARPLPAAAGPSTTVSTPVTVRIAAGRALMGAADGEQPFAWDNELARHAVDVPAFAIDAYPVTNRQFVAFVEAGGYLREELWRHEAWQWVRAGDRRHPHGWRPQDGGFALTGALGAASLPLEWPARVSHAEAEAYARFAGGRLPTEAEWQLAAYGDAAAARRYPWGDAPPDRARGNFDFSRWSKSDVGAHPGGATPEGVFDLMGNGWEWTATVFGPYPGFAIDPAYPGYSADFFDGQHYVLKGGGPFTALRLLRRSFRNWFFWSYPYVDAAFRCVREL